jgi:hypothetical protein
MTTYYCSQINNELIKFVSYTICLITSLRTQNGENMILVSKHRDNNGETNYDGINRS